MQIAARTAAWRGAHLPYDAEVEFIKSTGTQYINTNISPTENTRLEAEFKSFLGTGWSGCAEDTSRDVFGFSDNFDLKKTTVCVRGWSYLRSLTHDYHTDYDSVVLDNLKQVINGVIVGSDPITYSGRRTIHLFAFNEGDVRYYQNIKFRSFKIMQNDILKIDFAPVRFTNENGVSEGAMYDRVSGQLFRNQGTGVFEIGPDKT